MSTTAIVIIVIVVIALVVIGLLLWRQQQSKRMRERFGPEYERTVEEAGDRRAAERDLRDRAQRREQLQIRALDPAARDRYAEEWRQAQARFVDSPHVAVREADVLVARVMQDRGYPVGDFEQQARDISVDHSDVVNEYRAAHDISQRNDQGEASTEDLREAMVHYRALFAELLDTDTGNTERSRV